MVFFIHFLYTFCALVYYGAINVNYNATTTLTNAYERQYYIDKIVEKAPEYRLLFKIKPGITSWGQVKYGYAENVDQMIERLKYDLLYIENMSLAMDFKILITCLFYNVE